MARKTSQSKGKSFKLPLQRLTLQSILTKTNAFRKKHNGLPTALILQFEIDLNAILRNNYYLIGYLKSGSGKNTKYGDKLTIPKVNVKETKLELPNDKLAFGNIVIPLKKLLKLVSSTGDFIFTPKLYSNPHAAYDINGSTFYPSPPAGSNFL